MEGRVIQVDNIPLVPSRHKGGIMKRVVMTHEEVVSALRMVNEAYLKKGQSFEEHSHPSMEEVFYILAGQGQFTIDQKSHTVNPGDYIYIPPNSAHSCTALSDMKFICFGVALDN